MPEGWQGDERDRVAVIPGLIDARTRVFGNGFRDKELGTLISIQALIFIRL